MRGVGLPSDDLIFDTGAVGMPALGVSCALTEGEERHEQKNFPRDHGCRRIRNPAQRLGWFGPDGACGRDLFRPDADTINGTPGADVIHGRAGADTIRGLAGNDTICGGAGADVINGGAGADRIRGGTGADGINGRAGADRIWGGANDDVLRGAPGPTGSTVVPAPTPAAARGTRRAARPRPVTHAPGLLDRGRCCPAPGSS